MSNVPIKQLIQEYDMEDIPSRDLVKMSLRYVDTMPDSQARALLFLLAARLDGYKDYLDQKSGKEK